MARIHPRAASARAARARSRATGHKKRPYKVILESITQEKKKLYTVISFEAEAPPGYTFIPAGNPHLTNRCKELSREHGVKVLIVSTTPHKNHKSTLSHQVHRIGHHFPSWIVGQACMDLGLHISRLGHVIRTYQGEPENGVQRIQKKRKNSTSSDLSQATLNAEARDAIKDLFPKIPEADLNKIISRAFQKGKSRVGTASELSLPRRVQLAVVAHIRHVYTNYDKLLRTGTYHAARAQIEQKCLDQLVQWRGDGEDGSNDMEEILREVIVISDDEEDDADSITNSSIVRRDSSVEIISSHALADDVQVRPVDYRYEPVAIDEEQPSAVEHTAPRILHCADRVYQGHERRAKERFGRRGFSRYRAWDQALDRYRMAPVQSMQPVREAPIDSGGNLTAPPQPAYGYRFVCSADRFLNTFLFLPRLPEKTAQPRLAGIADGHYTQVRGRIATMEDSRSRLRPSSYHRPQSPPEYLETDLQPPITAREGGYSSAIRSQARSVQDKAYLDSAAKPVKTIRTDSGRKLDQQAISRFWQQQERILPSIEGSTHHVDSCIVRRDDNGFSSGFIEQEIQPHAEQQNPPTLIRSGHPPVVPRIIELDGYDENHLTKRRKVTDLAYRQSSPVPVVTSEMLQNDVSGRRRGRVEWLESDLSSRRPTQGDTTSLYELEHGPHSQRNGTHRQVQTTMESTRHHEPSLRSLKVVDTDEKYQDPYHVVLRSTNGDFVRDPGYQNAYARQPGDRTHLPPESRAARLPAHRSGQYDTSSSAHWLPGLLEADRTSRSTPLVSARLRDADSMNVSPMYSTGPQRNTSKALRYVRMSEGDQSHPIYINESVQLTPGASARHQATTRDEVMGTNEYVRYEQIPEDEHFAGKPYPIYRRPPADPTGRPSTLVSELRKVEDGTPQPSYLYTYENATKAQPLLRSYHNEPTRHATSEDSSNLAGYLPSRAERRRYVGADRPDYVNRNREPQMARRHLEQTASLLRRATDWEGRSYEPRPTSRPRREVIVLD